MEMYFKRLTAAGRETRRQMKRSAEKVTKAEQKVKKPAGPETMMPAHLYLNSMYVVYSVGRRSAGGGDVVLRRRWFSFSFSSSWRKEEEEEDEDAIDFCVTAQRASGAVLRVGPLFYERRRR